MASIVAEIEKLMQDKYLSEELNIDTKLHQLWGDSKIKVNNYENHRSNDSENEEALKRNKHFLKETDLIVSRYRSRSLYSPLDGHLEACKIKYLKKLRELKHSETIQRLNNPPELGSVKFLEKPIPRLRTVFGSSNHQQMKTRGKTFTPRSILEEKEEEEEDDSALLNPAAQT